MSVSFVEPFAAESNRAAYRPSYSNLFSVSRPVNSAVAPIAYGRELRQTQNSWPQFILGQFKKEILNALNAGVTIQQVSASIADFSRLAILIGHLIGPPTSVSIDDIGEISLEWKTEARRAVVSIAGDGIVGYATHDGNIFVPGIDIELPDGTNALRLVDYIRG